MRLIFSALAFVILAAPVAAQDEGLTGYWKVTIYDQGQPSVLWLANFDKDKDGKLVVTAEALKDAPKVKVNEFKTAGDTLTAKFQATINGQRGPQQITFDYEGRLPKAGAKKIYGTFRQGSNIFPVIMESTSAKNIFELDREILQRTPSDPRVFVAIFDLIDKADENKVEAKDLQAWIDSSLKSAALYGPRFQLRHQTRLLSSLQKQKAYAEIAVETARKLSKQIDPKMPLLDRLGVCESIANVLRVAGKKQEAEVMEAQIDKFEIQAYADFHHGKEAPLNFKTEKFAGRKGKSTRAVLVELFTGAECPPCVAADMAFDGLEKTYKPGEVVLLQYHMHIPRPDPLSNPDSSDRFEQYNDAYPKQVRGTPTVLFNGKPDASGGGFRDDAPEKYTEFCAVVNKLLETPDTVKLSAGAARTGSKIAITAKVTDLDKPGDKVRLRIALVEDWVRYKGSNGLQYHHRVVRAMPGGAKGTALKEKSSEHKETVDLDNLRTRLNKFLNEDYPDGPRPMRLQNLSVVVFVQNDESTEVLQAVNVPVRDEK